MSRFLEFLPPGFRAGLLAGMGCVLILGASSCNDDYETESAARENTSLLDDLTEILDGKDARRQREQLLDLEQRLRSVVDESRLARLVMLQTCWFLNLASQSLKDPEKALLWRNCLDERSRQYITLDPADGRLRGYVIQHLAVAGRLDEARMLMDGSAEKVDLKTVDHLVGAVLSLEGLRHLGVDPSRAGSRRLVVFYERLVARVRRDGGRLELLEKLLCEKGLVLLSLNQVAEARKMLKEMESLGVPGGQYFRLQTALEAVPTRSR